MKKLLIVTGTIATLVAGTLWLVGPNPSTAPALARILSSVPPPSVPTPSEPAAPDSRFPISRETLPPREEGLRQAARQSAAADIGGTVRWISTLSVPDRVVAAEAAIAQVGQSDPAGAIELAAAFQVGVDDGRLEHFAQIWTEENPTDATAWLAAQPAGEMRDRLAARIARVRARVDAGEAAHLLGLISDGAVRDAAVAEVIGQWKLYAPAEAGEALAHLPTLVPDRARP